MGIPVNEDIMKVIAAHCSAELQPMCAFFGGVVAQELVKISGKFTPIQQYFNFAMFEALPDAGEEPADTAPLGCRYDNFIAVYGKQFQEMLGNLKIFMVRPRARTPYGRAPGMLCRCAARDNRA